MSPVPKRLLFVITKSFFGGAQRYVFELAVAMQAAGHTVAVACGGREELVSRLEAAGILTFEIIGAERDINLIKELRFLRSLGQIVQDFKPDIIHLNSSKAGLLGSLVARLLRVPKIIFTAHGWPFLEDRPLPWRLMAWLGSYLTGLLADRVILVSQHDQAKTHMPGVLSKCTVIHTSVPSFPLLSRAEARQALFSEAIVREHEHNIWLITHGEINHNKNHTAVINAIAEFNSTHLTKLFYTIIGSGDLAPLLKDQVSLKGLTDYVHFLGYQSDARQYLLGFDIYVMPSKKEGLPYSLLESGMAGVPCIASRVGGIPEVILDHETGLLTDPENHMTIVAALDFLLINPDKRTLYSDNLKQHLTENFSPSTLIAKTAALYNY